MSREEFEILIKPDLELIKESLMNLREEIEMRNLKIHSVEVIGGASRTPAVQALVAKIFK